MPKHNKTLDPSINPSTVIVYEHPEDGCCEHRIQEGDRLSDCGNVKGAWQNGNIWIEADKAKYLLLMQKANGLDKAKDEARQAYYPEQVYSNAPDQLEQCFIDGYLAAWKKYAS